MLLPDKFIDHASPAEMYETAGLTAQDIVRTALGLVQPAHKPTLSNNKGTDIVFPWSN